MATTWQEEPVYSSDWLKHWNDRDLSFEEVTIKAGSGLLASGTMMKDVNGVFEPAQAGDTLAGILRIRKKADGPGNIKGVVLVWGAVITTHSLSWHASFTTQALKQVVLDQLAAMNIKIMGDV